MSEEGFVKHGMLTEESQSDFDSSKKAKYGDAESPLVADEANKHKLKKPVILWPEYEAKITIVP